jgi:hypothetical protein
MNRIRAGVLASLAIAFTLLAARPAVAQTPPEGWRFFRTGDFAVSPMMLGPAIMTGEGGSGTVFAFFTDFDYHAWGPAAIGALFNFGFKSGFVGLNIGPQFKYKFQVGSTSHVPYVKAALPLGFWFPSGGDTNFTLGIVQFGGGYKYFFHRMVGAGIELGFIPTILLSPDTAFLFGINIQFGVEIKI